MNKNKKIKNEHEDVIKNKCCSKYYIILIYIVLEEYFEQHNNYSMDLCNHIFYFKTTHFLIKKGNKIDSILILLTNSCCSVNLLLPIVSSNRFTIRSIERARDTESSSSTILPEEWMMSDHKLTMSNE